MKSETEYIYCTQCGKQIKREYLFCNYCGAPVKPEESPDGEGDTDRERLFSRADRKIVNGSAEKYNIKNIFLLIKKLINKNIHVKRVTYALIACAVWLTAFIWIIPRVDWRGLLFVRYTNGSSLKVDSSVDSDERIINLVVLGVMQKNGDYLYDALPEEYRNSSSGRLRSLMVEELTDYTLGAAGQINEEIGYEWKWGIRSSKSEEYSDKKGTRYDFVEFKNEIERTYDVEPVEAKHISVVITAKADSSIKTYSLRLPFDIFKSDHGWALNYDSLGREEADRIQTDFSDPTADPTETLQEEETNSRPESESSILEDDKKRRIVNCTDFTENGLALASYEENNGDINWCIINTDLQVVNQLSEEFSLDWEVLEYNLDMNGNVFFVFEHEYALIYDTYTKIKKLSKSEYNLIYRNRYGYGTFERNTSEGYNFEDVSYVLMDYELNILSETTDEEDFAYPTADSDMDFCSCEYLFFDDKNMYNAKTNTSCSYFDIYRNYCDIKAPDIADPTDYEQVGHSCTYNKESGKYEIAFLFQDFNSSYEEGYYENIICVVDENAEVIRVNKIRRSIDDEYRICWESGREDYLAYDGDYDEDYEWSEDSGHEGLYNLCFANDDDTLSIYSITTGEKIFDSSDLGNIHVLGYSRYDEYTSIVLEGADDESTYLLLIDQNGDKCFDPLKSNTAEDPNLYICSYDNGGIFSVQTKDDNRVYYNFKGKELHRMEDPESFPQIFISGLSCADDRYFNMKFEEDIFITVQSEESSTEENGKKENTDGTVIKAESLEQGYVSVIRSYEEKYGEYQSSETNARIVWKGVCFLHLVNLNNDNIDELIIGYQVGDPADQASIHYMFDIYGYGNNEVRLLASSESWAGMNSPLFGYIAIIDDNGSKYVQLSESSYSHKYYGYDSKGNFGAVHSLRNTAADGEYPGRWLYNGELIDDTEYTQLYTSLHNRIVYELSFAEGDALTKIPELISDVKDSLAM